MNIVSQWGFKMNGIIVLNKPKGMTSHDCVNRVRKILHTKKVGHTGTLDPNVTGVLPICINDATKIIQFLTMDRKTYEAVISLSYSTTTEDVEGEIVMRDDRYKTVTASQIEAVLKSLLGVQTQVPPMVSAVKVQGKKLYEYARKNIEVERPTRTIEIYALELLDAEPIYEGTEICFKIRADVSKGTYIRTLAVEIGKRLGYPAHLKDMVRTKSGHFTLDQAVTLTELEQGEFHLITPYEALKDYYYVEADPLLLQKIKVGQKVPQIYPVIEVVFVHAKEVYAVYRQDDQQPSLLKPVRVLINQ